jgi:hypothetical protein
MGLDNIPLEYPCRLENTAILTKNGAIDCDATRKAQKCPYQRELAKSPVLEAHGGVSGMFGTSCWYRGKYGNWMIDQSNMSEFTFYGDTEVADGQEGADPEYCNNFAQYMKDNATTWSDLVDDMDVPQDQKEFYLLDWGYAQWWLKFVAEFAGGFRVWY